MKYQDRTWYNVLDWFKPIMVWSNLIMNEYAYSGKGHSIHSSGQIEWYTNTVDDKSVQVGGQQRIVTIDGYSMPLIYKGGLMYLELQGIPTGNDLQTHPSVHLTIHLKNKNKKQLFVFNYN